MEPADYPTEAAADHSLTIDLGEWINTFVLAALPLVGFVLLCAWAFGRTTPPSKANWARAMLLLYALGLVVALAVMGLSFFAKPGTQVLSTGPGYQVVP